MKPSEVLRLYSEHIQSTVDRHHARNARVFGSVVHGNDTENSDLDLLVDPLPGVTLFDLGAMQVELEESLGVSVDILTPGDLPMKIREQVLQEARKI